LVVATLPAARAGFVAPMRHHPVLPAPTCSARRPPVVSSTTVRFSDGSIYQGDVLDGRIRHGQGVLRAADGSRYEGRWQYDQRSGQGKILMPTGLTYQGEWRDDLACG
jgi:hypothetical protein